MPSKVTPIKKPSVFADLKLQPIRNAIAVLEFRSVQNDRHFTQATSRLKKMLESGDENTRARFLSDLQEEISQVRKALTNLETNFFPEPPEAA